MHLSEEWIIRTMFGPNSAAASPFTRVNSQAVSTMRSLDLSDIYSRTGGKIETLGKGLHRFRSLNVLSLAQNHLYSLKGIEHCQQLCELDV